MIKNKAIFFYRDGKLIRSIQNVKSKTRLFYKKKKFIVLILMALFVKPLEMIIKTQDLIKKQ